MSTTRYSLLVRLRQDSDETSWSEFVAIYQPFLQAAVRRVGVPAADCDDLVQDLLVALLDLLPMGRYSVERGRFRGWLRTLARNRAIDWLRSRRRRGTIESASPVVTDTRADDEIDIEHQQRVIAHSLECVRRDSHATTWACFEQHVLLRRAAGVVASELQLSANSVYVNSFRTLERVRAKCRQLGEDLSDAAMSK